MALGKKKITVEELQRRYDSLNNLVESLMVRMAQIEEKYRVEVEKLRRENKILAEKLEKIKAILLEGSRDREIKAKKVLEYVQRIPPLETWLRKLPATPSKLLRFLSKHPDKGYTRKQLALLTGYSSGSGSFNSAIATLIKYNLVVKSGDKIKINPKLVKQEAEKG